MIGGILRKVIIGRIILDRKDSLDYKSAVAILTNVISSSIKRGISYEFLITRGGFVRFDWPSSVSLNDDTWFPQTPTIKKLQNESTNTCKKITQKLRNKFTNIPVKYLTIGIDSYSDKQERSIELVHLIDLTKKRFTSHVTGKSYPLSNQQRNLYRISDLSTHLVKVGKRKVLVLGCHDLNMFTPRRSKTCSKVRKKIRKEMESLTRKFEPTIVLQHPHTSDSVRTWCMAKHALLKKFPSIEHFASAGSIVNKEESKKIRKYTVKGDVFDILVNKKGVVTFEEQS